MSASSRGSDSSHSNNERHPSTGADPRTQPAPKSGLEHDQTPASAPPPLPTQTLGPSIAPSDTAVVFEQIELDSEDSADEEYRPSEELSSRSRKRHRSGDEGESKNGNGEDKDEKDDGGDNGDNGDDGDDGDDDEDDDDDEMKLHFTAADREELQFEVNVLHSSDDEEETSETQQRREGEAAEATEFSQSVQQGEARTASEQADVTPTEIGEEIDFEQQQEEQRKAYIEFLKSLYTTDASGTEQNLPGSGEQGLPSSAAIVEKGLGSHLLPDDNPQEDPNFDYLTAAACFPEDLEEFRDDPAVQVSRREISDLISGHEPVQRPVRTTRKDVQARPIRPRTNPPIAQAGTIFPAQPLTHPAPFNSTQLSPDLRTKLQIQMATHVQLLLHLHVNSLPCSSAASTSASLLEELTKMRDVSMAYKRAFAPYMDFPRVGTSLASASVQSLFNTPALGAAPAILAATAQGNRAVNPEILRSCGVSDYVPAANDRLRPAQYNSNEAEWTEAEDRLLAYILQTTGVRNSDPLYAGASKWSLLPHRSEAECEARVKTLSSRRVKDNIVKETVLKMGTDEGLSKEEWARIKEAVEKIGETDWLAVAREANVSKRPDVIEREWRFRKRKREAKRRERARAKLKRQQAEAGVTPTTSSARQNE